MKNGKKTARGVIHHGAKGWAVIDRHGHILAYNRVMGRDEVVDIGLAIGPLDTPYMFEVFNTRRAANLNVRKVNASLTPGMRCNAVHAVKISTTITFWEN